MHLLAATPGSVDDGKEPIDLGQTPADVIFISAADTELAALSTARSEMPDPPGLRLASMMHLQHPMSVDLHIDACASKAKLVVARVLGGAGLLEVWVRAICRPFGRCRRGLCSPAGRRQARSRTTYVFNGLRCRLRCPLGLSGRRRTKKFGELPALLQRHDLSTRSSSGRRTPVASRYLLAWRRHLKHHSSDRQNGPRAPQLCQ